MSKSLNKENKKGTSSPAIIEGEIVSYDKAREILESGDKDACLVLAKTEKAAPEVLYYLAENGETEVRQEVAKNTSTPFQADDLLSGDPEDEVRIELARKIARIVPDLRPGEADHIREHGIQILEKLAQDQLPKIRAIIAEEIKRSKFVPKSLVKQLAMDVEATVCAPVLEYSPLLSDADLKEIVAAGVIGEALVAVANRQKISSDLAEAIASTLEIPAVAALLTNKNAEIRDETLVNIVEQARGIEELHEPLTKRPNLSVRIIKRIAGFVASSLIHTMLENNDISDDVADDILKKARHRIDNEAVDIHDTQSFQEKAQDFFNRGMITDEFVIQCVNERRRQLMIHCVALQANVDPIVFDKMLTSKNARAIVAITWAAGLKMRTALAIQSKVAMVPPDKVILARNGIDYPFDDAALERDLQFFVG